MQNQDSTPGVIRKKQSQLDCITITSVILPAVRASVAEKLLQMGYGQESIAKELGIAQAAVSKYKNQRYSEKIKHIKNYIDEGKLYTGIIESIETKKGKENVEKDINSLCENLIAYCNS